MYRFYAFYRICEHHKLKNFLTHVGICKSKKVKQVLERDEKNPNEFKEIKKDIILRLILKDIIGSSLGIEIFLKKRKHKKKSASKYKIEASLYPVYWVFKKIPFKLYTYVLANILQNCAKFIQTLTHGFKNHMTNLSNFRQAVESPKS